MRRLLLLVALAGCVGHPTRTVAGAAGLGLVAGAVNRDHGHYHDSLRPTHDKQAHAFASIICAKWVADRVRGRWLSFAACTAAGAAFELGQSRNGGYASWGFDLPYDVLGSFVGSRW